MEITTTGKRKLGAVVGSIDFWAEYKQGLVKGWVDDVKLLANIAKSEPQRANTAMIYAIYTTQMEVCRTNYSRHICIHERTWIWNSPYSISSYNNQCFSTECIVHLREYIPKFLKGVPLWYHNFHTRCHCIIINKQNCDSDLIVLG